MNGGPKNQILSTGRTGNAAFDRLQDILVPRLNDLFKTGATLIQGKNVEAPTAVQAGQVIAFDGAAYSHQDAYVPATPGTVGLIAWNMDPAASGGAGMPSSGALYLLQVRLLADSTITNLCIVSTAAGSALTSGHCFAGLYDSTGLLLRQTSDQSSAWSSDTGFLSMPLSEGPVAVEAGMCWVALLANGSGLPTWTMTSAPASAMNLGLSAGALRVATNGSGLTSPPSHLVLASNTATGAIGFWVGVS